MTTLSQEQTQKLLNSVHENNSLIPPVTFGEKEVKNNFLEFLRTPSQLNKKLTFDRDPLSLYQYNCEKLAEITKLKKVEEQNGNRTTKQELMAMTRYEDTMNQISKIISRFPIFQNPQN